MQRLATTALLSLGLLTGCTGTMATANQQTPAALVTVAKPLGTRQCEQGGPTAETLAQALRDAGVRVAAVACAHDGRMRPAVCGASDGRLAVVDIAADQQAQAAAQGWQPLATWPDARRQPC